MKNDIKPGDTVALRLANNQYSKIGIVIDVDESHCYVTPESNAFTASVKVLQSILVKMEYSGSKYVESN